jgi:hypothetical protein
MSNEPTIEQMNEAIALFMGMQGTSEFLRQNYQIDKDWQLLMIVVEKIHNLKVWREGQKELKMFSTITVDIEFDGHYKQCRCSIIGTITFCRNETIPHTYNEIPVPHIWVNKKKTAIEATHNAVYQFITWFNQQKQNDE